MRKLTDINARELVKDPIVFFGKLYQLICSDYDQLSGSIYTDPAARALFEDLKVVAFNHLRKALLPTRSASGNAAELQAFIEQHRANREDHTVCCLALFSALGAYIGRHYNQELRCAKIKAGSATITSRPYNPIHQNTDKPVREHRGTGIHNITDVFSHISIIRRTKPVVILRHNAMVENTNALLRERIKQGLRIAVTPFMENLRFVVRSCIDSWPPDAATPYWFESISNGVTAKARLYRILKRCLHERIAVLVLPELTIDSNLLNVVKNWLRKVNSKKLAADGSGLLLVAAGSFHMGDTPHDRFNLSTLLNHGGKVLLEHRKMKNFEITKEDVKAAPSLQQTLKISPEGGHERIRLSKTLNCIDTPLGRIAVCICIDYFHEDTRSALQNSRANLFLVPTMSPTVDKFHNTAKSLGDTNLSAAFIANSSWIAKKDSNGCIHKKGASFCYVPDREASFKSSKSIRSDHIELLYFELKVKEELIDYS